LLGLTEKGLSMNYPQYTQQGHNRPSVTRF